MAFAPAETEKTSIVADEGYAFAGVAWPRAEVTRLDPLFTISNLILCSCLTEQIPHFDRACASFSKMLSSLSFPDRQESFIAENFGGDSIA